MAKAPLGDRVLEYGKDLWTLSNVVAGFAIVQTLLFLEEAGKHCSMLGLEVAKNATYGFIGVGVFLVGELGLIYLCYAGHKRILALYEVPHGARDVFRRALWVRVGIVTFSLIVSFAFMSDQVRQNRGSDENIRACMGKST